jgi:hypothetical protein
MQLKLSGGLKISETMGKVNLFMILMIMLSSVLTLINPSEDVTKATRVVYSILSLVFWCKLTYYLSFFEQLTLLVRVTYKVLMGIRVFNVILLIVVFAFANSFYFIGQNQIEFDGLDPEENPSYSKHMGGALEHIVKMIVLEFEFDAYTAGQDPSQIFMLYLLFVLALMVIIIVLLNLLIAIMADIF